VNERRIHTRASEGLISLQVAIHKALALGAKRGERVFVVGGIVRDLLMGRAVGDQDLDLVVEGIGTVFARELTEDIGGALKIHQPFLTAKLSAPFSSFEGGEPFLDEVDIATARTETYERPGALPTVAPASIEKDLWRRDFSINAMALPLAVYAEHLLGSVSEEETSVHLVDPCAGYTSLRSRTVRILHPSSFVDDPTRLFRAVRYCVRLSFELEAETSAAFRAAVEGGVLATISPRRVWNELMASFDENSPQETIRAFVERGLFSHFPVVSPESLPRLIEGVNRLMIFHPYVEPDLFADAAKQLVVALAPDGERSRIVKAVQERRSLLTQAQSATEARDCYSEPSTLLAAFGVHGSTDLRESLRIALGAAVS
jgi:tRNA nucleotidyltransferase/poly(A) polymerase